MLRVFRCGPAGCVAPGQRLMRDAAAWLCLVVSPGIRDERWEGPLSVTRELPRLLAGDAVVFLLGPADREAGLASLGPLYRLLAGTRRGFAALVSRREPPLEDYRDDGPVGSFACSARLLREYVAELRRPYRLCYLVLQGLLASRLPFERVMVRQIPLEEGTEVSYHSYHSYQRAATRAQVAVLLPHRGPAALLGAALRSVMHVRGRPHVLVGLDTGAIAPYRRLAARYPEVEFFVSEPAPVGPYAIRHALAERARERLLLFQDSDDISCWERIAILEQALRETGCAMVGSHELRLDEIWRCVRAIRFPLDVSAALRARPHHPMLLPTTLLRRDGYFATGGFSTDRAFAYDTQFVFRASFLLGLRNVDEFLYIRRRRRDSLTTAPETGLGTPVRVELLANWTRDFLAVKAGRLALERSSLWASPRPGPYRLFPLDAAARSSPRGGSRGRGG